MKKNAIISRLLLGGAIILFGVLMLLDNLGYIAFWEVFQVFWPLVLVVVGFNYAFRRLWLSAFFFAVIGGLLIALNLNVIDGSIWTYIIPVGVMMIGLALLLPAAQKRSQANKANYYQDERNSLNQAAILGGAVKKVTSQQFQTGDVLAVFGSATLDLRAAELDPKGSTLEVTAIFGGIDIIAPQDWQIDVRVSSIFGGVDDRRTTIAKELQTDQVLVIHGVCFFGGLEIKN